MQTWRFSISSLCFRCSSCSFSSYSFCSFADSLCSACVLASREDSTWTVHSTAEVKTLTTDTRTEDANAGVVLMYSTTPYLLFLFILSNWGYLHSFVCFVWSVPKLEPNMISQNIWDYFDGQLKGNSANFQPYLYLSKLGI